MFRTLLKSLTRTARKPARAALSVEALERRELLNGSPIELSGRFLEFYARPQADNRITLQHSTLNGRPTVLVSSASSDGTSLSAHYANMGGIRYFGGNRTDHFENRTNVPADVRGGLGNDTLLGGSVSDTLLGEGGNDLIRGDLGNDTLRGGDGNDTLYGGPGADVLDGGAGTNQLYQEDARLRVNDVRITEAASGSVNAVFTVSLDGSTTVPARVNYATANGTATTADYAAASGTLTFNPGEVAKAVTVRVNADTLIEADETFRVRLSGPVNAEIADAEGVGTIADGTRPPVTPALSINDVRVTEGASGTVNAVFAVSLSAAVSQRVTVRYATANGTAAAGSDYNAASGTLTFNPGESSKTVAVQVRGDTTPEGDETFFVNLSAPSGATVADGQGVGTIGNHVVTPTLPTVSVGDARVAEGGAGITNAVFTVTLSRPSAVPVSVRYATANGTAAAGSDYDAVAGTLTFNPGETRKTITVQVRGDAVPEADETYYVNLSSPVNVTLADGQGLGIIVNHYEAPAAISGQLFHDRNANNRRDAGEAGLVGWVVYNDANLNGRRDAGELMTATDGAGNYRFTVAGGWYRLRPEMQAGWARSDSVYGAAVVAAPAGSSHTIPTFSVYQRGAGSLPGVFRNGQWFLDTAGDAELAEQVVNFGQAGDTPLVGDWNGDGRDDLVVVRRNTARGGLDWHIDTNRDGVTDAYLQYGLPGDTPLMLDWNGDGRDEVAVVRRNAARGGLDWYLDLGRDGYLAEHVVQFGLTATNDMPIIGDWDGDGRDEVGVVRHNAARGGLDWYLDTGRDGYLAERVVQFGLTGDVPVVGDWDGDGKDDVGVTRGNPGRGGLDWFLDVGGDGYLAERIHGFGLPGDRAVAGRW